ncbi:MAG: glycosyltransferase family 2 protein [Pirellulales bacterium]|nr:glycosyltransferase family 2 protein [Pirellulales bacterium]
MFILASIALGLCVILSGQCIFVGAFVWMMYRHRRPVASQTRQPKAAVVLALRGPDPFLDDCIRRLLAQDYQDYTIFLVVDNDRDPVLGDIERLLEKTSADKVVVSILKEPHTTCSLKCSAMIQAVRGLDESYEVVAFLDGDALPHPRWLLELVAPLEDTRVGVTYGNRWYVPAGRGWGSWIRYCWNVGAVIQVWFNDIVWAGSMAMRIATIKQVGLLDAWSTVFSDDSAVHRQMREHQFKIRFVPSVIMVNREAIALDRFIRWVQRQLIAAKSCGSGWRLVGLHAMNLAGAQLFALAVMVTGLFTADRWAATAGGIGLACYWGSSLLSILASEWAIRRITGGNGEAIRWDGVWESLKVIPGMLLTQIVYPCALATALLRSRVVWRGIEYDIRGVGDVQMLNYHPYVGTNGGSLSESVM